METDKTNTVSAEEIIAEPAVVLEASFDPATGIGQPCNPRDNKRRHSCCQGLCVYWGDRARDSYDPPFPAMEHIYLRDRTYRIRIDIYDTNHNRVTYTYLEEPSLEVVVVNP